ncbi:unnamed protein product [Symbiodinium sp. CCMP2456]|nr:unnamed protein product [Symbiodinium sp. CCMP2456]
MKHWPNWQQVVAGLGFDVSEHMGKSRQAVVAKGGDASDSEQEHWFSTEALLSLLVHWMAVALDGTRIGKPGLEVVLMPATDLVNLRHCVLPPQAITFFYRQRHDPLQERECPEPWQIVAKEESKEKTCKKEPGQLVAKEESKEKTCKKEPGQLVAKEDSEEKPCKNKRDKQASKDDESKRSSKRMRLTLEEVQLILDSRREPHITTMLRGEIEALKAKMAARDRNIYNLLVQLKGEYQAKNFLELGALMK